MPEPRFGPGDRVRVAEGPPEAHCRTPLYLRGRRGVVQSVAGVYRDPAKLAFHLPGLPAAPLYRVRFAARDLWEGEDRAARGPADTVVADLYERWLAPDAQEDADA